jgi:hypothetical protein
MRRGSDHERLRENGVRKRHRISGMGLALDVSEHFAPFLVHADYARRVESFPLEEVQQRVDSGCPRASAAPYGVPDVDCVVEVSAERTLFHDRERGYARLIAR